MRFLVLAAWMAMITYWSSQGNLPIDQPVVAVALHGYQHKVAHLIAFGLLGLLARWAFDGVPRATLLAVLVTSAFGAADEWHQSVTPGRRPAIDDWALDTASALLTIYVLNRLRATRLEPLVRALGPLAVSAAFVVAIGLAAGPALPQTLESVGLRGFAHGAVQLMRETRNVARQFRLTVSG
jgi:hypothetical protein